MHIYIYYLHFKCLIFLFRFYTVMEKLDDTGREIAKNRITKRDGYREGEKKRRRRDSPWEEGKREWTIKFNVFWNIKIYSPLVVYDDWYFNEGLASFFFFIIFNFFFRRWLYNTFERFFFFFCIFILQLLLFYSQLSDAHEGKPGGGNNYLNSISSL